MIDDILSSRRNSLLEIIEASIEDCEPHSGAFTAFILGQDFSESKIGTIKLTRGEVLYGGFPQVACVGFQLNGNPNGSFEELEELFIEGVKRLRNRPLSVIEESLASDDIALLGIAIGLSSISEFPEKERTKSWLLQVIDSSKRVNDWTSRIRDLAADLLDHKGRLRTLPQFADMKIGALEIVIRHYWSKKFSDLPTINLIDFRVLLENLLKEPLPHKGDLELAAIWLKAIDVLLGGIVETLLPKTDREIIALSALKSITETLDSQAEKKVTRILWGFFIAILGVIMDIVLLILQFGWEVMEPWTTMISFIGIPLLIAYFLVTAKEFSLTAFRGQLLMSKKRKMYQRIGLDLELAERLIR